MAKKPKKKQPWNKKDSWWKGCLLFYSMWHLAGLKFSNMATRCGGKCLHLALIGSFRMLCGPADSHLREATCLGSWLFEMFPLAPERLLGFKIWTAENLHRQPNMRNLIGWLVAMDRAFSRCPLHFSLDNQPTSFRMVYMPRWIYERNPNWFGQHVRFHGSWGKFQ